MKTFEEWWATALRNFNGRGRFAAQDAWYAAIAQADPREAELRAEIAAKDAEIERLRYELGYLIGVVKTYRLGVDLEKPIQVLEATKP